MRAVLTHDGHLSGTDRVAEVAARPEFAGFDVVANVQGDEPFVSRGGAGRRDRAGRRRATTSARRRRRSTPELAAIPARVKVVTDARGGRCTFRGRRSRTAARSTDPADGPLLAAPRALRVHARGARRGGSAAPPSPAEQAERLEQLRALHCGLTHRRGPADRAGAARRRYAGRPSTGGSPLARTSGVSHMTSGPNATKYIFVTGGVVSSLGKGIAAASLGRLLVERGLQRDDAEVRSLPQRRSRARCRRSSTARCSSPTTAPRPTSTSATTSGSSIASLSQAEQRHHRPDLPDGHQQGAPRRVPRLDGAGDSAHHRRDQGRDPARSRRSTTW